MSADRNEYLQPPTSGAVDAQPRVHVPSMSVWGRVRDATYHAAELYEAGNPYIEALQPIMATPEAAQRLRFAPVWEPGERTKPAQIRLHKIFDIPRFYMPLPQTFELEAAVSSIIRASYQDRNPMGVGYWRDIDHRVKTLPSSDRGSLETPLQTQPVWTPRRSHARGFSMVGITGAGKSSAMEMTLGLYDQIIRHTSYHGTPFPTRQIVWLKLQCPYNGAIGSLCLNFFQAVDDLLETTSYTRAYTRNYHAKVSEMLPAVARVAANHGLGILVIDEIQRLSRAKSGGAKSMLDFFGELVDTIGVPVVLIGTYRAQSILQDEFLEARRGTGFGPGYWGPIEQGKTWDALMRTLFRYQYLNNPIPDPVKSGLGAVIHDVSQGIPDFAVKAFVMAQVRAITSGKEKLSPEVIYSATRDGFRLAQPWLDRVRLIREAFAHGTISSDELTKRLAMLPEADPVDLTGLIQAAYEFSFRTQTSSSQPEQPEQPEQQTSHTEDALSIAADTTLQSHRYKPGGAISGMPGENKHLPAPAEPANTPGVKDTARKRRSPRKKVGEQETVATSAQSVSAGDATFPPRPQSTSTTRQRSGRQHGGFPVGKYREQEGLVGIVARGIESHLTPYQALRNAALIFNPLTDPLPGAQPATEQNMQE